MRTRTYRCHELPAPPALLTVEIHGRDGTHLIVRGVLDRVSESYSNTAQRLVLVDAVAGVLPA